MAKKTEGAAPAAEDVQGQPAQEQDTTLPTSDADKVAAWREATEAAGLEQAEPATAGDDEEDPDGEQAGEDAGGDEGAGDGAGGAGDQPDPDAEAKAAREKADAEHAAAVDAEVKTLGLKGKTEERFRELSGRAKVAADLEKERPAMVARIQRADEFEDQIIATGATPEQFGRAMAALQAVNSEDPVVLGNLEKVLEEELVFVRKKLGKKAGDYDPLTEAGNEDLAEDVRRGELSEARALELAQLRVGGRRQAETRQHAGEAIQAQQHAVQAVAAWGGEVKAIDPQFAAKMEKIAPAIRNIQQTLPPEKWLGAVKQLYLQTRVEESRRPPGRVNPRPQQSTPAAALEEKPKDALDALRQGIRGAEKKVGAR